LFLAIEAFEYKATTNLNKIAYISIGLPIVTIIYCLFTLHSHNFIKFIDDLKFIQSMRFYMKLLEKCLYELKGFLIFLGLITFAFASSSSIIDKN